MELMRGLRGELTALYGDRLNRALLYGSRARGDATPESDYDVAVILNSMPDRWAEFGSLANLTLRFFDRTGAMLDIRPYDANKLPSYLPVMAGIMEDGIPL